MSLGQRIMQLRTQRGWSQDELSGKLDVSRQSVSKWETDASVPELDKLLRLSDLFGATLDELVRGEEENSAQSTPEDCNTGPARPRSYRTAGLILLCFGALIFLLLFLLGGGLFGLLYAAPFLLSALVCFFVKRHTGLWCGWAVFFSVDLYLRYAAGLNWSVVRHTLTWEASMNYMRLIIAWLQFLGMVTMLLCTLRAYRGYVVIPTRRAKLLLGGGWFVFVAAMPLLRRFVLLSLRGNTPELLRGLSVYFLLDICCSYLHLALLIFLLHSTAAAVHAWRDQRGRSC